MEFWKGVLTTVGIEVLILASVVFIMWLLAEAMSDRS